MRKPILFSALLALYVCPTLASYAGTVDSQSQHGSISDGQSGTMRSTESGLTAASTADSQARGIYVDLPPVAEEKAAPKPQVTQTPAHQVHSQTNTYVWTK